MNILDKLKETSPSSEEFRRTAKELREDVAELVHDKLALFPIKIVTYVDGMYGGSLPEGNADEARIVKRDNRLIGAYSPEVNLNIQGIDAILFYKACNVDSERVCALSWHSNPNRYQGVRIATPVDKTSGEKVLIVNDEGDFSDRYEILAANQLIQTGRSSILETIVKADKLMDDLLLESKTQVTNGAKNLAKYK